MEKKMQWERDGVKRRTAMVLFTRWGGAVMDSSEVKTMAALFWSKCRSRFEEMQVERGNEKKGNFGKLAISPHLRLPTPYSLRKF
jgi:hypothetical protein